MGGIAQSSLLGSIMNDEAGREGDDKKMKGEGRRSNERERGRGRDKGNRGKCYKCWQQRGRRIR